jgi:poly(hydroxyalkanoate) depolymerase family esterase
VKLFIIIIIIIITFFSFNIFALDYKIYVPESAKTKSNPPLVVLLHGCTQDAENFMDITKIKEEAQKRGFIVLAPEKKLKIFPPNNPLKCWAWYLPSSNMRDPKRGELKEIMDLVATVKKEYSVDENKVFIAGFSAGAVMSSIMANCYPDVFKGAAIDSGIPYKGLKYSLSKEIGLEEYIKNIGCKQEKIPDGTVTSMITDMDSVLIKFSDKEERRVKQLQKKSLKCAEGVSPDNRKLNQIVIFQGDDDKIVWKKQSENIFMQFAQGEGAIEMSSTPIIDKNHAYKTINYKSANMNMSLYEIDGMNHAWAGGKDSDIFSDPKGPNATKIMLDQFGL